MLRGKQSAETAKANSRFSGEIGPRNDSFQIGDFFNATTAPPVKTTGGAPAKT